jgi:3-oxoacyl-[acyl-carrier protein] reductase
MTIPSGTNPFDLSGRAALVTGAGTGIGRAVAETLAAAGAAVGVHYRSSEAEARETAEGIVQRGGRAWLLPGVVGELVERAGRLDVVVNNAGSPLSRTRIEDCPLELWQQVLALNLTSGFLVVQAAIPHLRATGRGAIVNVLSLSVRTGGANGAGPYAVAKGGLETLTRTLARELAPGIRTNSVMPGVIETRHHETFSTPERMEQYRRETPLGRNGTAQEVADAVLFLASDAARFVNGAILDVNGGRMLR